MSRAANRMINYVPAVIKLQLVLHEVTKDLVILIIHIYDAQLGETVR